MSKNGLSNEIGYHLVTAFKLLLNVFTSLLIATTWVAFMLLPAMFSLGWLLWVTVPVGFALYLVVMFKLVGRR